MASSGTVVAPVIDGRFKPSDGHDSVLLMGSAQIKSTATLESGDLDLRTIKALVVSSYDSVIRQGAPVVAYGSVTVSGSLGNNIRIRSFRGSLDIGWGTVHVGTISGGTMKVGFFILGS